MSAAEGPGMAILGDSEFTVGEIQVEARSTSFVGLGFHVVDDQTYAAVWLRPFNFRHEDPLRRSHAVQYASHPDHPWNRLRDEQPGRYEAGLRRDIDPAGWLSLRIVVGPTVVAVHLDHDAEPTLAAPLLPGRHCGSVALWVGHRADGAWRSLRIVPAHG